MNQVYTLQMTLGGKQTAGQATGLNQLEPGYITQPSCQWGIFPNDELLADLPARQGANQELGLPLATSKTTRQIQVTQQKISWWRYVLSLVGSRPVWPALFA